MLRVETVFGLILPRLLVLVLRILPVIHVHPAVRLAFTSRISLASSRHWPKSASTRNEREAYPAGLCITVSNAS